MKKRISTLLALVLTIALLASSFVMLGVAAEDTEPTKETITIGGNQYEVIADKKYAAYDSMAAAVNGLTPATSDYKNGPTVSFSNTAWKAEARKIWGKADELAIPAYIKTDATYDYTQIAFYPGNPGFGQYSVSLYKGGLHVNPSNGWLTATEIYAINLSYTATEAGKVVLYDTVGKVSASTGANAEPFWDWHPNNTGKSWVTFSIYKNSELLWPKNNEDNKFEAGGEQIDFPDLGEITVAVDDVITVKVEGYSPRAGIDINPAVAYTSIGGSTEGGSTEDGSTGDKIQVGNNEYNVLTDESSDLYSDFTALTANMEPGKASTPSDKKGIVNFTGKWKMEYRYVSSKDFNKDPWGGDLSYKYCVPHYISSNKDYNDLYGIQTAHYLSINSYNTCLFTSAVTLIPQGKKVYICPTVAGSFTSESIDKSTYAPTLKVTYTSYADGKAVLYDTTGIFDGNVAVEPYWANETDAAKTKIEIYKNNQKIWPTDGDKVISKANTSIAFPDLGEIDVKIGDQISFLFYGNPEHPATRTGVMCNPAVAFTQITKKGDPSNVAQTDANFSNDVMVLAGVIVALGAVVVSMGVISKKRAHN